MCGRVWVDVGVWVCGVYDLNWEESVMVVVVVVVVMWAICCLLQLTRIPCVFHPSVLDHFFQQTSFHQNTQPLFLY